MSVYDRRYGVHTPDRCSHYVDTPEEVQRLLNSRGRDGAWVDEGYGDYRDTADPEVTEVVRRTVGRVALSTIDFLVERRKVQTMLERLRGAAA